MSSLSELIDRLVSFEDESQKAAFHRLLKQRLAFVPLMAIVAAAGTLRELSGPEPLMAVQVANTLAAYLPVVLFTEVRASSRRRRRPFFLRLGFRLRALDRSTSAVASAAPSPYAAIDTR